MCMCVCVWDDCFNRYGTTLLTKISSGGSAKTVSKVSANEGENYVSDSTPSATGAKEKAEKLSTFSIGLKEQEILAFEFLLRACER